MTSKRSWAENKFKIKLKTLNYLLSSELNSPVTQLVSSCVKIYNGSAIFDDLGLDPTSCHSSVRVGGGL